MEITPALVLELNSTHTGGVMEEAEADVSPVPTVLSPLGYSILSFWMFLITVFSVFNNSLVIVVMVRNRQLLFPMNILILSLAISDLLMTICGSAIASVTNYYGQFFMARELCVFQGFTVNYFGLVSLCTLTLLAYERYNVVCKPMGTFKVTIRRSSKGLLLVWLHCLFWAAAPLLGWSSYGPEGVQTSCSLAWEERTTSNYSYLVPYWFFCFLLPTGIIIYCYYHILISMRKLNLSVENQGGRSRQHEDRRAACMVAAMIGSFFLCWMPYAIVSIIVIILPDLHIAPLLASTPAFLAKTSPVYNPIIFFLANKQFRNSALQIVLCGLYTPTAMVPDSDSEVSVVEDGTKRLAPNSIQPEATS
ncbi:opsin-VA-like [Astyanax mexicanus]|uniref:Opsin-VA-like n=2 Tax=Astyanax mexicanus TaxID=7994 RepID=A0A8T2M853_ASTMX|nr:opsin-VA-like [Astyanax mexicanus]